MEKDIGIGIIGVGHHASTLKKMGDVLGIESVIVE